MSVIGSILGIPPVARAGRRAADWIDLEWSSALESLRRVAPRARGRLLDVGCGSKPYEAIFRPFVDSYVGVEHEATYAATNAAAAPVKADVLYDGNRLPFDDESFDTVLSVQVLEHTPRPRQLVSEMARVLRKDGILILTAPFSFRLHEEPHDYFRYTPHGLRSLCEDAGLEVEAVEPRGSLWSVVGHKVNSYLGLQVAQIGSLAQNMGKLSHEQTTATGARLWTLPVVAPAMVGVAFWARVLDRLLPDRTEMLGLLVIARRKASESALPGARPPREAA